MEDFNEYIKNGGDGGFDNGKIDENTDLFKLVNSLATRFDGKSSGELLSAIYREAEKGKRNGTLSNAEIDNFGQMIAPFLGDKKKKILDKVIDQLKKI